MIAYPTDTFYGLGADPRNGSAVARLFDIKGRQADQPILLLISDSAGIGEWAAEVPPHAAEIMKRYWPGPLTLVLTGGEGRGPEALRGPEGGIAVRWMSHPHIARLVERLGEPLTSTSANRPGSGPAPGADAIARDFAGAIESGRAPEPGFAASARAVGEQGVERHYRGQAAREVQSNSGDAQRRARLAQQPKAKRAQEKPRRARLREPRRRARRSGSAARARRAKRP